MLRTLMWRLFMAGVTLLIVSMLLFAGTELLPGDTATTSLGQAATEEAKAAIRNELGLDRPAVIRYGEWLSAALQGDLGTSYTSRRAVADEILPRLGNTLFLAAYAAVIGVPLALAIGVTSAIWRNSLYDRVMSIFCLVLASFPAFFVAYLLIAVLSVRFNLLPSISSTFPGMSLAEKLHVTSLPVIGLVLMIVPHIARMTRAAIFDVWSSAFIEMALIKGVKRSRAIWAHALPNALAPIISVIALNLAFLLTGVLIIEVIFVYAGLGPYMVDAVALRDMPTVQAAGVLFAMVFILLNLIADMAVILANPKLRHPK